MTLLRPDSPKITVIIPFRNEEGRIGECLSAVLSQTLPQTSYEVLAVDGMSEDGSAAVVEDFLRKNTNLRLLKNPNKIVSSALNLAIKQARGEIIVRVDGHTVIEEDYLAEGTKYLEMTGVDNVGGPMRAIGTTYTGEIIALATSCPFGIGNGAFHYSNREGFVDTVYLGIYPRRVFEKIGLFDEDLVRNQDDEFNYRLRKAGGKVFLNPAIRSYYYCRSTLKDLWRQYFQYGFWKVRVFQKHPQMMQWRQFVPALFVLSVFVGLGGGLINRFFLTGAFTGLGCHFVLDIIFAFKMAREKGWNHFPVLPLVFNVLHWSYGFGFLMGLIHFSPKWFERRSVE